MVNREGWVISAGGIELPAFTMNTLVKAELVPGSAGHGSGASQGAASVEEAAPAAENGQDAPRARVI